MTLQPLDPRVVYDRGLADPDSLSEPERLVYLILELETYSVMEGWYHFFTTDKMRFYRELRIGLVRAGDLPSCEILADFETHLAGNHVALEAEAINDFVCSAKDAQLRGGRDWATEFEASTEHRWQRIAEYLRTLGIAMVA